MNQAAVVETDAESVCFYFAIDFTTKPLGKKYLASNVPGAAGGGSIKLMGTELG